jgi:multidrug resistance protein MdtO
MHRTEPHGQLQRELDGMRDRVGKNIAELRTMSEAVEYEFGDDREQRVRSSELILQSPVSAAAPIWNQVAFLHGERGPQYTAEPGLVEMGRRLAERLNILAQAVAQKTTVPEHDLASSVSAGLLQDEHYGEYAQNTLARTRTFEL